MTRTYDAGFWDAYADGNEARYNPEFARFVAGLAASLRCSGVLEVGCGTGIDLRLLPGGTRACGADPSARALGIARREMPSADFCGARIEDLPFADSSVDLVFTHQLLNHLGDGEVGAGIPEMLRVASRYVMSCERFGEDGAGAGGRAVFRDMRRRWSGHGVRVVSDVDMHSDIEPDGARFTLVRKL